MNDQEKCERLRAAPPNPTQRLVLAAVLCHVRDGWCTASLAELVDTTGLSKATVKRAIAALIPKHLERVVQKPNPSALKPAQRLTAMSRSTGHSREPLKGSGGSRSTAHSCEPFLYKESNSGATRVRNAAQLDRMLRGTNVVELGKRPPASKH